MNILISSYVHWWNAEAAYAAVLAETLLQAGHRVWVLTQPGTTNWEHLQARGLPVRTDIPLDTGNPWRLGRALADLRTLQRQERIDVVNVFHAREFPWHLLARRGMPELTVVRTRGSAQPARGHALNRWLYGRACDGLVASAEVVRLQMEHALALPAGRVRTVYFPAENTPPPDAAEKARMRIAVLQSLALPPQSRLLALVGRIAPEKGQDILVEAMALLSRHLPEATLLLLDKGYADEAPRRVRLLERIAALGLERRVHLLGFRKDVRALMGAVELGVIPSVASEVNCRVAMEFFSVGTPVLAFPTGALPEVVEPGISGQVTADYSPAGLARALESMLARPEELERLGNGALRQARTRFSRERFLRDSLAVFEQARRKK